MASLGRRPGGNRDAVRDTAPRQFIFGDGAGGVERIRIDLSGPHLDHLRAVMDTTPDALREARPGRGPAAGGPRPGDPAEETRNHRPRRARRTYAEEQAEFDLAADFELGLTETRTRTCRPDRTATATARRQVNAGGSMPHELTSG